MTESADAFIDCMTIPEVCLTPPAWLLRLIKKFLEALHEMSSMIFTLNCGSLMQSLF